MNFCIYLLDKSPKSDKLLSPNIYASVPLAELASGNMIEFAYSPSNLAL
jgi:hypothetical protein